ncbi:hypothetical protein ABGB16_27560 [Micromonospora sp. B11E3]|uniref:hypothetical protein n=1 Tax=Micromonospora sp. B11E3 TaxID=3153562 RepID=UPI00325F2F0B
MLFRLAYLGVTNALALLRLLPTSDRDKHAEILALRHQVIILERQLNGEKVRFTHLTGHGSPPCCTGYPATRCATCGCWSARTRCRAGTGTC